MQSSVPMNLVRSHLPACSDGVGLRDVAREREQQRDRVLGGGDVVAAGRVHDDDAARVAAATSMLSTPMPARPMTRRRAAAAITSRR